MTWHWWKCSECGYVWGSEQPVPDREWCACGTVDEPESIVRPPWQVPVNDGLEGGPDV